MQKGKVFLKQTQIHFRHTFYATVSPDCRQFYNKNFSGIHTFSRITIRTSLSASFCTKSVFLRIDCDNEVVE